MQPLKNLLFIVLAAPAAYSICCISVPGGCDGGGSTSMLETGIFNADVWVPEGAKNVLTNATINALQPLVCCCMAANDLACRTRCDNV
ncbi:hypothetical protein EXIGLDRAFT_779690 [Exidia glandulosa HHB12029]|uniref:Hydrophobin n=1 Tax=Exidia glandulosa HHB12029 TaxID=1314781 RepID=A0A165BXS7_EXIGL|nr:hypothetical protein EXIGLDRAFT_779690 [Exidia glandulosa HHB12029]